MSVLDQFRDAEQRVAQRLKELEPAVAEYRELEQIAQRLGIDPSAVTVPAAATKPAAKRRDATRRRATATVKPTASKPTPAPSRRARGDAGPGRRAQQLIELVRARPGITVRDAGKELGVDPTGLYRVVRRLELAGELRKNGRELEPAAPSSS